MGSRHVCLEFQAFYYYYLVLFDSTNVYYNEQATCTAIAVALNDHNDDEELEMHTSRAQVLFFLSFFLTTNVYHNK